MAEHAWEYGWLMSDPKGPAGEYFSQLTCFHYEPWHYRYYGKELAAKIHASGETTREYLWTNFTMVDPITGQPLPTPTPTPSPTPTETPTPSPSPTPTPSASPSAAPSAQPAATWFGVDPPIVLGGLLVIVLAAIGFAAWRSVRSSASSP
jgi:hypothetical protein